jgi:hypothetical protein
VLGFANENEEDGVGLDAPPPKALVKGAPNGGPVALVELVPKLNPVLGFAEVVDVSVLCPKLNALDREGIDCPSENALSAGVALLCPNEKPPPLPVLVPKPVNAEDGGCMADVSFFSTVRVGLSPIWSPATSILSPLSADGFGVLGAAAVPTLPKPPKTDFGAAGVVVPSPVVAPVAEANAFVPDVTPNVKPDFFSAGGGVEGAAPNENGDGETSVSDALGAAPDPNTLFGVSDVDAPNENKGLDDGSVEGAAEVVSFGLSSEGVVVNVAEDPNEKGDLADASEVVGG